MSSGGVSAASASICPWMFGTIVSLTYCSISACDGWPPENAWLLAASRALLPSLQIALPWLTSSSWLRAAPETPVAPETLVEVELSSPPPQPATKRAPAVAASANGVRMRLVMELLGVGGRRGASYPLARRHPALAGPVRAGEPAGAPQPGGG